MAEGAASGTSQWVSSRGSLSRWTGTTGDTRTVGGPLNSRSRFGEKKAKQEIEKKCDQ